MSQLCQFTKICKGGKLTVEFPGIRICVSSSMPTSTSPQLVSITSRPYSLLSSTSYLYYFSFLHQTFDSSKKNLFPRQNVEAWGWSGHVVLVRQDPPAVQWESKSCSLGIICNTLFSVFEVKYFITLSCLRTACLCTPPLRLCRSIRIASTTN
jgi:hypothetical protein